MEDTPRDAPTTPIETPPESKPEEATTEVKAEEAQSTKTQPPPTTPPAPPKPRRAYTRTEIALIIVSIAAVLLLVSTIALAVCGTGRHGRCGMSGYGRMGQGSEKGEGGWQNYRQKEDSFGPRMMPRVRPQSPVPGGQSAPAPLQQTPTVPGQSP